MMGLQLILDLACPQGSKYTKHSSARPGVLSYSRFATLPARFMLQFFSLGIICVYASPPLVPSAMNLPGQKKYGIPTSDGLFKFLLNNEVVRSSFLRTFLPKNISVQSSTPVDVHMSPFKCFQLTRKYLNLQKTRRTVSRLSNATSIKVTTTGADGNIKRDDSAAEKFLRSMVAHFEAIQAGFPQAEYSGSMDFACMLDSREYALIEVQVVSSDAFDARALAYAAAYYGNQLKAGHFRRRQR